MADAKKHINYSFTDIQRYLQGSMSASEMHDLEHAALEDPFLADALEGYSETDLRQAQTHLVQMETALRQPREQGTVLPIRRGKKFGNWQVAASVILLICIAGITYFIFNKKASSNILAENKILFPAPKADSVSTPQQQAAPLSADTIILAQHSGKKDKKIHPFSAENKKRSAAKKQLSTPEIDAPIAAAQSTANPTMQRVNSAMAFKSPANEITGIVTDSHQQPIPNATIMLQDSTTVITDKNGNFTIPANDKTAAATITAFGYKPLQNESLKAGYNNIILKEKPFLLSEVEVINIGNTGRSANDTTATMPQGGWQSFKDYIITKLQNKSDSALITNAYMDEDVELEFSISEEGEPTDFKILHSPDAQTANEAITAIKTGPRWTKRNNKNKMRITLKYK